MFNSSLQETARIQEAIPKGNIKLRGVTQNRVPDGVTIPEGTLPTDILIIVIFQSSAVGPWRAPGWNLIVDTGGGAWNMQVHWARGNAGIPVFTRADGLGNSMQNSIIMSWSGLDQNNPIRSFSELRTTVPGNLNIPIKLNQSPCADGDVLLIARQQQNSTGPASPVAGGERIITTTGMTAGTAAVDYISSLTEGMSPVIDMFGGQVFVSYVALGIVLASATSKLQKNSPQIQRKNIRTTQPQTSPSIDWSNPITKGMYFAFTPSASAEFASNMPTTTAGSRSTKNGNITTGALNTTTNWQFGDRAKAAKSTSVFVLGDVAGSVGAAIVSHSNGAGGFKIGVSASSNIGFTLYGITDYTSTTPVSGSRTMAAVYRYGTDIKFYQNGLPVSTVAAGNMIASGDTARVQIGGRFGGADVKPTGTVSVALIWERALTDAEMLSISDNPWQIFSAEKRPAFVEPPEKRVKTATFANTYLRFSGFGTTHNITIPPTKKGNSIVVLIRQSASAIHTVPTASGVAMTLVSSNMSFPGGAGNIPFHVYHQKPDQSVTAISSTTDAGQFLYWTIFEVEGIALTPTVTISNTGYGNKHSSDYTTTTDNELVIVHAIPAAGGLEDIPTLPRIGNAQYNVFVSEDIGSAGVKNFNGSFIAGTQSSKSTIIVSYPLATRTLGKETSTILTNKAPTPRRSAMLGSTGVGVSRVTTMAGSGKRDGARVQPPIGTGIDWNNSVSRGLVDVFRGDSEMSVVNKVKRIYRNDSSTTHRIQGTNNGTGYNFLSSGTGDSGCYYPGSIFLPQGDITIFLFANFLDVSNAGYHGSFGTGSGSPYFHGIHFYGVSSGITGCRVGTGAGNSGVAGQATVVGTTGPYTVAASISGLQFKNYFQGRLINNLTASAYVPADAANGKLSFGGCWGLDNTQVNNVIMYGAIWNRALSEEEVKALSANPWAIFENRKSKIWIPS